LSIHVESKAWRCDGLSPSQKVVLVKLANCGNDVGRYAFPSIRRIALECSIGRSTVKRAIAELKRMGLIMKQPGVFQTTSGKRLATVVYCINIKKLEALDLFDRLAREGDTDFEDGEDPFAGSESATETQPEEGVQSGPPEAEGVQSGPPDRVQSGPGPGPEWTRSGSRVDPKQYLKDKGTSASASPPASRAPEEAREASVATPINAHWRSREEAIKQALGPTGEADWRHWLADLIPHKDDGETLTLATWGAYTKEQIERNYSERLARAVDRKIVIIVTDYALMRHRAKRDAAESK
jgi:DNA-binding MarR family transcriptional regulator